MGWGESTQESAGRSTSKCKASGLKLLVPADLQALRYSRLERNESLTDRHKIDRQSDRSSRRKIAWRLIAGRMETVAVDRLECVV